MSFSSTSEKTHGPRLAALPRYLSALVSQGLVSGFHFVLNLALVTLLTSHDFGLFALVFVLAYTATSVTNALFATPLQVYAPAAGSESAKLHIQSMITTLMSLLIGICLMLGCLTLFGLSQTGLDTQTLLSAMGFVLAYVVRQYSRSYGYARFDVIGVLIGDMTYVMIAGAILSGLFFAQLPIAAHDVFIALTAANAIAVLIEIARLPNSHLSLMRPFKALAAYQDIWLQARWALIGSVTTILVQQAHTAVVVALKNPESYAPLAAGFILFGPVRVLFQTIQNVVKPEMALAIAEKRPAAARKQMFIVSALSVGGVLLVALAMQAAWPWLNAWLYQKEYADEPMRLIVSLWAAITLIGAVQNGPYTALQSLRLFQPLAVVTIYGAGLGLALVTACVYWFELSWSLLGVLAAETFVAVWVVRLVLAPFNAMTNNHDQGET